MGSEITSGWKEWLSELPWISCQWNQSGNLLCCSLDGDFSAWKSQVMCSYWNAQGSTIMHKWQRSCFSNLIFLMWNPKVYILLNLLGKIYNTFASALKTRKGKDAMFPWTNWALGHADQRCMCTQFLPGQQSGFFSGPKNDCSEEFSYLIVLVAIEM